jgi:hypothetical protein
MRHVHHPKETSGAASSTMTAPKPAQPSIPQRRGGKEP